MHVPGTAIVRVKKTIILLMFLAFESPTEIENKLIEKLVFGF